VNGVAITQTSLNNNLKVLQDNPGVLCLLSDGAGQPTGAGGTATTPTSNATEWLSRMIEYQLLDQIAASRGVTPSALQVARAHAQLIAQINETLSSGSSTCAGAGTTASAVLTPLPGWFVSELVDAQATANALVERAAARSLTTPALRRYFIAHRAAFGPICVNVGGATTTAEATLLRAKLVAGIPMALAAGEGNYQSDVCVTPSEQAYAEVQEAVDGLAAGGVSQPVSDGQAGYVVFQLVARMTPTFAASRGEVASAVREIAQDALSGALQVRLHTSTITVNPRYGTIEPNAIQVIEPPAPQPTDVPNPAANLPTAAAVPAATTPPVSGGG
jgi:hypothetical protein